MKEKMFEVFVEDSMTDENGLLVENCDLNVCIFYCDINEESEVSNFRGIRKDWFLARFAAGTKIKNILRYLYEQFDEIKNSFNQKIQDGVQFVLLKSGTPFMEGSDEAIVTFFRDELLRRELVFKIHRKN